MDVIVEARTNQLLARMPRSEAERFASRCEPVDLVLGTKLATRGEPLTHAYFPIASCISLISAVDGGSVEVGLAGDEGMVGVSLALGVASTDLRAMVQAGGPALRITASAFRRELDRSPALRSNVARYTALMMNQLARSAGCNRFHVVEQRVARWLLMTADRIHADEFDITHEILAAMLGVRRVGVTTAAMELQAQELIRYSRGHLRIVDRQRLERAACSCYRADIASYDLAWDK
jgi:CRP-like cAMP-binding protein